MKLKKVIKFTFLIGIISCLYLFRNNISDYILKNFVINNKIVISEANTYYKDYEYNYVHTVTNFEPNNKQDLLNIFYTILNNGWTTFQFYCNPDYKDCYNDINYITKESEDLSIINNMVNPFNSYKYLTFEVSSLGKVTVNIQKLYTDDEISYVNEQMDKIIDEIITDDMTTKEKIKAFHDYVINMLSYDTSLNIEENGSNKAYGALVNKKAVCSGYSDLMAIFLDRLGIKNYKIINDEHVWNLLYLDEKWQHIDLTWDDPTTSNGKPILIHDFFLIDTSELERISNKLKNNQHVFNKNIYIEAK